MLFVCPEQGFLVGVELVDVFCGAFHGSGAEVLLVGLLEGDGCRLRGDEHIPALAILLHHAPRCSFSLGSVLTAEFAPPITQSPSLNMHIVTAVGALHPVKVSWFAIHFSNSFSDIHNIVMWVDKTKHKKTRTNLHCISLFSYSIPQNNTQFKGFSLTPD